MAHRETLLKIKKKNHPELFCHISKLENAPLRMIYASIFSFIHREFVKRYRST